MVFQADYVYDLVHLHLPRLITPVGYNGVKYVVFFINDLSCCPWKFDLKTQNVLGKMLEEFHQMIKMQIEQIIKQYRNDNNLAIINNHMRQ